LELNGRVWISDLARPDHFLPHGNSACRLALPQTRLVLKPCRKGVPLNCIHVERYHVLYDPRQRHGWQQPGELLFRFFIHPCFGVVCNRSVQSKDAVHSARRGMAKVCYLVVDGVDILLPHIWHIGWTQSYHLDHARHLSMPNNRTCITAADYVFATS